MTSEGYEKCFKKACNILGIEKEIQQLSADKKINLMIETLEALKKDNDMLNLAIDNGVDSFHVSDKNGVILRVNRIFEQYSQVPRQYVEGKSVIDMEKEGVYGPSAVTAAIREKRKISMIQNGRGREAIATANPVLDENGEILLVVSNARFVDEIKLFHDYYEKQSDVQSLEENVKKKMISESELMESLLRFAEQVAKADSSIMITGETGCGKSLLAKYIHEESKRKQGRFVEINCAAIPESLIESELFGYETGAFTGAKKGGKPGLIELADNGTLFLDEIGDMPLNLQVKLLHTLQNKTITRIGGENQIDVNIRLIAATNKDLEEMMAKGEFRSELYYRINVVPMHVPALRNRREDIPPLIEFFIKKCNEEYGTNVDISKEVVEKLCQYDWPGNIRELENLIERLIVTNKKGFIDMTDLPNGVLLRTKAGSQAVQINKIIPLKCALEEVERQLVLSAYEALNSSYKVAKHLEISQSGANRKIQKYTKK